MSPNEAPFSSESAIASVPGKVFLLGEYAVLGGAPALVATLGPRFELRDGGGGATGVAFSDLHPRSPAGRLLAFAKAQGIGLDPAHRFVDPYRGEGGFGASTAQFALAYGALGRAAGWDLSAVGVRRVYRELMVDEKLPPSGADLVAQWSGGIVRFDPSRGAIDQRSGALDWSRLLVFSAAGQAGRKVPTHEHLALISAGRADAREGRFFDEELLADLTSILSRADRALESGDASGLGMLMSEYARVLAAKGLELEAARADREALARVPGVLGVKGTGALLADAVVVWLDQASDGVAAVEAARERGLRLVARGLGGEAQPGWT